MMKMMLNKRNNKLKKNKYKKNIHLNNKLKKKNKSNK